MNSTAGFRVVIVLCLGIASSWAQPFGLTGRVANTSLRFPVGVPGYRATNAFPGLALSQPLSITAPPGETNRLFIVEKGGRIVVITNLAAPTLTVFMNLSGRVLTGGEQGLLGMAFHPGYATNRYFFVYYTLNTTSPDSPAPASHQRLARFETTSTNANVANTNSELRLFTQFDEAGNHNGGDLHFGPDGYLYITLGDEGNQNDSLNNSQRIDKDFHSGILRIDVDKRPGNIQPTPHNSFLGATNSLGGTNYFVPIDNPFVGTNQFNGLPIDTNRLRAEFWATGLRNPWRISFDSLTGVLYCGDVGGGAREEVNVIVRGGNYGWAYREGTIAGPKSAQAPPGFSSIPPIAEYGHGTGTNQGNSITGGIVYRGAEYPALYGKYVFADYGQGSGSGSIWVLTPNGTNTVPFQHILTDIGMVAFGPDPRNGDVLMVDIVEGQVKRLVHSDFPQTLSQSGIFSDITTLTPHAGIVPYDVSVDSWADGADIARWFSIPNTSARITYRVATPPLFSQPWGFPSGTVWVQHFDMEMTNGVPESRRRIETRVMVRYIETPNDSVHTLTYEWNEAQTDANLVPVGGASRSLSINDGGTVRTQVWQFPSRAQCASCHISALGFVAGFNTPQMNRDFDYGGVVDNQIRSLNNAGYFNTAATNINALPRTAPWEATEFSLEHRVRSYLMANCGQCHRGSPSTVFDARIYRSLSDLNLVNGPLTNNLADPNNRVIKPGSLSNSVLLTRMSTLGALRMPPSGHSTLDTQAIFLISQWITNDLVSYQSFADWQIAHFGATNAPNAAATADPDGDDASNSLEWLTRTSPTNALEFWSIGVQRAGSQNLEVTYPRLVNRGFEVQWNTNITNTATWRFLDIPANRPYFAATNETATVPDATTDAPAKYYRVRVYEP